MIKSFSNFTKSFIKCLGYEINSKSYNQEINMAITLSLVLQVKELQNQLALMSTQVIRKKDRVPNKGDQIPCTNITFENSYKNIELILNQFKKKPKLKKFGIYGS